METLNSFQTLNYIKFRSNNTSKQERNNKYLENCMTEYINEKLTRIEYLKKFCFKFENQRFQIIVFIIFYYLYFVHLT